MKNISSKVFTVGTLVAVVNVLIVILNNFLKIAGADQVSNINIVLAILNGIAASIGSNYFHQLPSPSQTVEPPTVVLPTGVEKEGQGI